eukprot:SAG22_NODE_16355_length_327_cov_0.675439_2_plen_75_part_01
MLASDNLYEECRAATGRAERSRPGPGRQHARLDPDRLQVQPGRTAVAVRATSVSAGAGSLRGHGEPAIGRLPLVR